LKLPSAKERLEAELAELKKKYDRLTKFMCEDKFHHSATTQKQLINSQLMILGSYCFILQERLRHWDAVD
jgi:hypothetical protein